MPVGAPLVADLTHAEAMELMHHCHAILDAERHPGRRGRPAVYYAHAARAYEILVNAGSEKPVVELAEAVNALADATS